MSNKDAARGPTHLKLYKNLQKVVTNKYPGFNVANLIVHLKMLDHYLLLSDQIKNVQSLTRQSGITSHDSLITTHALKLNALSWIIQYHNRLSCQAHHYKTLGSLSKHHFVTTNKVNTMAMLRRQ